MHNLVIFSKQYHIIANKSKKKLANISNNVKSKYETPVYTI